jgi:NAD(P)-dependent dehydrogenase (short-subunit alcohol dehydrogenase family)
MSLRLENRVAVVTGGGRGIGRAIALGYAREGADVVITTARSPDEADHVAAESKNLPGSIRPIQADVTDEDDVNKVLEAATEINGSVDVLVNNAARGMLFVNERFMTDPQPFWENDPAAWRLVMDTNINGVFLMTRAFVPGMIAARQGRVINVTVNASTMVRRGFSPYGPSKAALEAMTEVWAQELHGTGVVINLLAPGGATATGMVSADAPAELELLSPEIVVPGAIALALTDRSGQRILGTEYRAQP